MGVVDHYAAVVERRNCVCEDAEVEGDKDGLVSLPMASRKNVDHTADWYYLCMLVIGGRAGAG